ncbi:MAG: hypothetical protein ABFS34_11340 [Gemmatimonadota bacterium]
MPRKNKSAMPRRNKSGRGKDQKGVSYTVSYQPDWLKKIRVSRKAKKGKKAMYDMFINPERPKEWPGRKVRTAVRSTNPHVDFEVAIDDPHGRIKRVKVDYEMPGGETVTYSIDDDSGDPPGGP